MSGIGVEECVRSDMHGSTLNGRVSRQLKVIPIPRGTRHASPAPTGERRTLPALRWFGKAVPKLPLGRIHRHLGVELDLLVLGLGGRGARDVAVTTPHDDPGELREAICGLLRVLP